MLIVALTVGALAVDNLSSKLATEVPAARERIALCAADRCTRVEAARAAFLVALHTYVSEGVADGELAAAVRDLDDDLFEDLPDVLSRAATTAPDWVSERVVDEPPIVVAAREGSLRKGFYRSLEELRTNAPGIAWTDPETRQNDTVQFNGSMLQHHQLTRSAVRELGRARVLGFSDGTEVYVVYGGQPRRAGTEFHRATLAGEVALYASGAILTLDAGGVPLILPSTEVRELDLVDGRDRTMGVRAVRELLAGRPALLEAFQNESNRYEVLLDYAARGHTPTR